MTHQSWWRILSNELEEEGFRVLPRSDSDGNVFEVWKWWNAPGWATLTVTSSEIQIECSGLYIGPPIWGYPNQRRNLTLSDPHLMERLHDVVADWLNAVSGSPPDWYAEWEEVIENLRFHRDYNIDAMR